MAYHDNSVLISSILYDLHQEFGSEVVLKFILWMDGVRSQDQKLPDIKTLAEKTEKSEENFEQIYIDHENVELVRAEVRLVFIKYAELMREWATTTSKDISNRVEDLLSERGL